VTGNSSFLPRSNYPPSFPYFLLFSVEPVQSDLNRIEPDQKEKGKEKKKKFADRKSPK